MYSQLVKLSTEELKHKVEFAERAGGVYGVKLAEMCTDIINHRELNKEIK